MAGSVAPMMFLSPSQNCLRGDSVGRTNFVLRQSAIRDKVATRWMGESARCRNAGVFSIGEKKRAVFPAGVNQRACSVACLAHGGDEGPPPKEGDGFGGEDSDEEDETEGKSEETELLTLAEAESMAAQNGTALPADFVAAAEATGLRAETLAKFLQLQGLVAVGFLLHGVPWVRDRLIADPRFLFKVVAEVAIDSGCATVAEVRKRGVDFWDEFEFYLSDLVVGIVLDVALVTLLAPVAIVGKYPKSATQTGLKRWLGRLPSAVFEASIPGVRQYTVMDRVACFFVKGVEYSIAGTACGLVGQGLANSFMILRRHLNGGATADDVPIPPLLKTALVWGMFMGLSSNTRYQIVVGLERLVDVSIAQKVPQVAYATTILIRFINNIIGGENFIDMARWAGVQ